MNSSLFSEVDTEAGAGESAPGLFAGVALERGIDRVLDYHVPVALAGELKVGQRVRVPLGKNNRPARGYVVYLHSTTEYPRTKAVLGIEDSRALLSGRMLELARWMSRYYVTPLGMVLQSVIPSAVKKRKGLGHHKMVRMARDRVLLEEILEKCRVAKRRAILARLLLLGENEAIELPRLAGEAGTTPATVRKLVKLGWISVTDEPDVPGLTAGMMESAGGEADIPLNEDQQKVFGELAPDWVGDFP